MSRVLGSKAERVVFSDEDLEVGDTPCPWCCTGRRLQPHPIPAPTPEAP